MKTPQREYLRSTLFGIENSVISTAGLIAGISVGTTDNHVVALGATVAIVIEAVAMGVGEYLSDDAVQELDKLKRHQDNPARSGALMMIAGTLAGLVPLLPVLVFDYPTSLVFSVLAALLVLFLVGFVKNEVLHTNPIKGGVKTLVVGGIATLLGVIVGLMFRQQMDKAYKTARKIAVAIIGFTVIAVGIALLILPGPGIVVIIAGLAILALEFEWAERHLQKLKKHAKSLPDKVRRNKNT